MVVFNNRIDEDAASFSNGKSPQNREILRLH